MAATPLSFFFFFCHLTFSLPVEHGFIESRTVPVIAAERLSKHSLAALIRDASQTRREVKLVPREGVCACVCDV